MAEKTRTIPRSALKFAADLQPAGDPVQVDNSQLFPFSMIARTPGVAMHQFWGRCVHDFAGMAQVKPSVSVDYCHNPQDVVGFADRITVSAAGLEMSGALVSTRPEDRAAEIAGKRKAGVPYEASILTSWDNLVIEEIPQGFSTEVNGQLVEGPVVVFRQWELWGVAICPYGSDADTSVQFSAGLSGEVSVRLKEPAMTQPAPAAPPAKTGRDYISAFGQKGAVWFAEGKPWDEAVNKFSEELQQENREKSTKIDELSAQITQLSADLEKAKAEYDAEVEKLKSEHDAEVEGLKEEFSKFMGGQPVSADFQKSVVGDKKPLLPQDNYSKFAGLVGTKMPKPRDE